MLIYYHWNLFHFYFGLVAQFWLERRPVTAEVAGSSPVQSALITQYPSDFLLQKGLEATQEFVLRRGEKGWPMSVTGQPRPGGEPRPIRISHSSYE